MDTRGLSAIGEFDGETMRVEGGVLWRNLVRRALWRGYLPRVLTNNLETTVGGTISTAGLGRSSHRYGMQADDVAELDVVTGDGRPLRCSRKENRNLFDAVRCGLGQFAVVVGARIRLRRVPRRVRTYALVYDELAPLLADQRLLIETGGCAYLRAWCRHRSQEFHPPEDAGAEGPALRYVMHVSVDVGPASAGALPDGLRHARRLRVQEQDQMAFADMLEPSPAASARHPASHLVCPVTECFLPWPAVPAFVERLFEEMPAPLVPYCNMMLRPLPRRVLVAPLLMRPDSDLVMGFGILPVIPRSVVPLAVSALKCVAQLMTEFGGKRYLTGWVRYAHDDWREHYGALWPLVLRRKEEFDPRGILNPGFVRYGPPALGPWP